MSRGGGRKVSDQFSGSDGKGFETSFISLLLTFLSLSVCLDFVD